MNVCRIMSNDAKIEEYGQKIKKYEVEIEKIKNGEGCYEGMDNKEIRASIDRCEVAMGQLRQLQLQQQSKWRHC